VVDECPGSPVVSECFDDVAAGVAPVAVRIDVLREDRDVDLRRYPCYISVLDGDSDVCTGLMRDLFAGVGELEGLFAGGLVVGLEVDEEEGGLHVGRLVVCGFKAGGRLWRCGGFYIRGGCNGV